MKRPRLAALARSVTALSVCLSLGSTPGCHVGNFSASIDSDTQLPQFEFSAIPSQWEPEGEDFESQESTGE